MENINREPDSLADALSLIEDLRQEIFRRPKCICIDKESPGDPFTVEHFLVRVSAGKTYQIEIYDGELTWTFVSAISTETPQAEAYWTLAESHSGLREIVVTNIKERETP